MRKNLIRKIEKIQERALNLIPELRSLSYDDQLRRAKIPTLAYRRLRGDMIDAFKHLPHIDGYDTSVVSDSFSLNSRVSRQHDYQLIRRHDESPLQSHHYYSRIREIWNNLPDTVVNSTNINQFKNSLDSHWADLDIRFDPVAAPPMRKKP